MSKGSRLASLQLFPVPDLGNPSMWRQQQSGGMELAFQSPECEKVKSPRKKNWVAMAAKDLPLSSYFWESI